MASISQINGRRHPDTFRWQIRAIWLVLGLIFVLVALTARDKEASPEPVPDFAPGACPAPCWQGLRPGETESEQVLALLRARYGEQQVQQRGDHVSWQLSPGITGRASLEGGQLGAIVFHFEAGRFSLGQLVQQVGEPQQLHVTLPHAPRGVEPERSCEVLRLLYPGLHMEVTLHESRSGEALPQHSVARIYLAPDRPQRTILTPFYTRDWDGYGRQCVSLDEVFGE